MPGRSCQDERKRRHVDQWVVIRDYPSVLEFITTQSHSQLQSFFLFVWGF